MFKNKDEYRFVLLIILFTLFIGVFCFLLLFNKSIFELNDWTAVSTVMQGTLGVAVSFAGAVVAIKLARLSTLIIEKEKSREDSRFYNEIITDALKPLKGLSLALQDFYYESLKFAPVFGITHYTGKNHPFPQPDTEVQQRELPGLKAFMTGHLQKLITALEAIHHHSFSHALWLTTINNRRNNKTLLLTGGGAGYTLSYDENYDGGYQGNYLIADLLHLTNALKLTLTLINETEVTAEDILTINKINQHFIYYQSRRQQKNDTHIDTNSILYKERQTFFGVLTYISLVFNNTYKRAQTQFHNRFFFLLMDLVNNFPNKNNMILFMQEVVSTDQPSFQHFPQLKTFDILQNAYWHTYPIDNALRDYPAQEIDVWISTPESDELAKAWYQQRWGITYRF